MFHFEVWHWPFFFFSTAKVQKQIRITNVFKTVFCHPYFAKPLRHIGTSFHVAISFRCRQAAGGHLYFCLKAAVKCSTLLNPEEKAMSATGWAVFRNNNSAFFNRSVSKY
jgi:hypothetical protein